LSGSLDRLSFKDKKLLENVEFLCPKCLRCAKFEDNLSIMRHKLECFLEGWKVLKFVGDYGDFEELVEYLLKHQNHLNHLPDSFAVFTKLVVKETGRDWNIAYGDCFRFGSDQVLALENKNDKKKLSFTCMKSTSNTNEVEEGREVVQEADVSHALLNFPIEFQNLQILVASYSPTSPHYSINSPIDFVTSQTYLSNSPAYSPNFGTYLSNSPSISPSENSRD